MHNNQINIPNGLSFLRIILSVIFSMEIYRLFNYNNTSNILLFILFLIICLTDIFDGKIARKKRITSQFGAKLDVAADIILVLLSYTAFVYSDRMPVWFLILSVTVFIEFIITSEILDNNTVRRRELIFDKMGRSFGIICMGIPGIIIFLDIISFNPSNPIMILIITLTGIMGCISFIYRLNKCYIIKKEKNQFE